MRILLLLLALVTAPAFAAGPKFSNAGGIGSATSTYSGGEPTGGTFSINGTTGAIVGKIDSSTAAIPDSGALRLTASARAAVQVTASDYCSASQMNGTAEATSCLQAASNALCARSNGGGRLFLPAGFYSIGSASTWTISCSGVEVAGAGIGDRNTASGRGTEIGVVASGSLPVIKVQAAATPGGYFAIGFSMHDISMVQGGDSVTFRSGPFIDIYSFEHVNLERLYLYATCIGVRVTGGSDVFIHEVINHAYKPGSSCHAFYITGNEAGISGPGGAGPYTLDVVKFENVTTDGPDQGSCFRVVDRVHTAWWSNVTCETYGNALKVDCPTMTSALDCPGFFTIQDFEAEYFGTHAENMIDITDMVAGLKMTQSWLRGVNGANFTNNAVSILRSRFTSADAFNVSLSDTWIKGSGGDMIYINTPGLITITGNQLYGGNFFNAGGAGISFGPLVERATATGNITCGGDWLADVTWQMAGGVKIASGADYITATGNVFSGDTNVSGSNHNACQAGVVNGSSGTHISTTGNVGP